MQRQKQNENRLEMKSLDYVFRRMDSPGAFSKALKLSPREMQILKMVVEGNTSREIALQLGITERTVKTYSTKLISRVAQAKTTTQIASQSRHRTVWTHRANVVVRPPINAEYVLYLLLRKEEREVVIGDLVECYSQMVGRFDKRRADIWFYKQVAGSLLPLLRRALLRIGALVWLGRILRRLIS